MTNPAPASPADSEVQRIVDDARQDAAATSTIDNDDSAASKQARVESAEDPDLHIGQPPEHFSRHNFGVEELSSNVRAVSTDPTQVSRSADGIHAQQGPNSSAIPFDHIPPHQKGTGYFTNSSVPAFEEPDMDLPMASPDQPRASYAPPPSSNLDQTSTDAATATPSIGSETVDARLAAYLSQDSLHSPHQRPPQAPLDSVEYSHPAPQLPTAPPDDFYHAATIPTTAPPRPAPAGPPSAEVTYITDEEAITRATKHARFAISALNFEDVRTAVKELKGALESLGVRS